MIREQFIVGVDIGGTNIVAGGMPVDGSREIGIRTQPTSAHLGAASVAERIAGMVRAVISDIEKQIGENAGDIIGVGIGSPGPMDRERGIVILTPHLDWKNYPIRDEVARLTGLRATLDNDANCATLGEWWLGAAKGGRNVIGLTLGTGIGGGIIIDGKLYHGSSDGAGEIGHASIDPKGRLCKCGNLGCLEAYASGSAIAERAQETIMAEGIRSQMLDLAGGNVDKVTCNMVFEAAKSGDSLALRLVEETGRYLGTGIANLLNIFNPDTVVIGGGVIQSGDALLAPIQAEVRRRAFPPIVDACRIVIGELPISAGVVGAVAAFKLQTLGSI